MSSKLSALLFAGFAAISWPMQATTVGTESVAVTPSPDGSGVPEEDDAEQVSQFYVPASERLVVLDAALVGDATARERMEAHYDHSFDRSQDYGPDLRRLQAAAAKGDSFAMLLLGHIYVNGLSLESDMGQALEWYLAAAVKGEAQGLTDAIETYGASRVPLDERRFLSILDLPAYAGQRAAHQYGLLLAFARRGVLPGVKEMLRRGEDLRQEDFYASPLYEAILADQAALVSWLIAQGRDWSEDTIRSALHTAITLSTPAVTERLFAAWPQDAEAMTQYLADALLEEKVENARLLLQKMTRAGMSDPDGGGLLAYAAKLQDPVLEADPASDNSLLALLLALGEDPNLEDLDGETPLFVAISAGLAKNANYLMAHGADVGHRNHRGETALFAVMRVGDPYFLTRLGEPLQVALGLGPRDAAGNTLLHAAIRARRTVLARLLLERYPAWLRLRNAAGETTLDLLHRDLLSLVPARPFDTPFMLRLLASGPTGLNAQLARWQTLLAGRSAIQANMHAFQIIVETYGLDWGGEYGPSAEAIHFEATQPGRAYWKELTNPFSGDQGLTRILLEDLTILPDPSQAGKIVYLPQLGANGHIANYWIYGVDNCGQLLLDKGLPYVLSNS